MRTTPAERTRAQLQAVATTGLDTPTFVAATLEVVARAVPFAAACLATIDPATRLVTSASKAGTMSSVDAAEDARWAFHEYVGDDLYDYRDLLTREGAVMTTHAETNGDPLRSTRFEDFFHPTWSVTDELRSAATADGELWAFLALFRDESGRTRTFNEAEVEFVSSIAPTVARGVRASLVTTLVAAGPGGATSGSGPGVLLVDAAGDVLSANGAASDRTAALGGGPLGSTPLPMPVQSVVKAAQRFSRGQETWAPRVRMRTVSGRWVVSASPMTSFGAGRRELAARVFVEEYVPRMETGATPGASGFFA